MTIETADQEIKIFVTPSEKKQLKQLKNKYAVTWRGLLIKCCRLQ